MMLNHDEGYRARYYGNIARQYGYHPISPSRCYQIIEANILPHQMGYEEIKPNLYGRQVHADIVQLIKFLILKGQNYTIWWGVSLRFLPHRWNNRLSWHRTFRSSRLDLFEIPFDYLVNANSSWEEQDRLISPSFYGEDFFQICVSNMWKYLQPEIDSWFDKAKAFPGILELSNDQIQRTWTGPHHFPDPLLVHAFTLARMGKIEEGRRAINQYFTSSTENAVSENNLRQAFEQVYQ